MKLSLDFPVPPRWIKNPGNNPIATIQQRMAAADRTKLCVTAIGLLLGAHWPKLLRHYTAADAFTRPNVWTVKLTRISTGTVDPITGGASMKAIQDALARWAGVPNERDPVWRWIEPIGQESRGFTKDKLGNRVAWTGVRIEVDTLDIGPERVLVLDDIDAEIARAKAIIKQQEAGKKADAATEHERSLREAVFGVHLDRAQKARVRSAQRRPLHGARVTISDTKPMLRCMAAWPWEQRPFCAACGGDGRERVIGKPDTTLCGLDCVACNGTGKDPHLALTDISAHVALDDPPATLTYGVPERHVAQHGPMVTLTRRAFKSKVTGACWLYE